MEGSLSEGWKELEWGEGCMEEGFDAECTGDALGDGPEGVDDEKCPGGAVICALCCKCAVVSGGSSPDDVHGVFGVVGLLDALVALVALALLA